MYSKYIVFLKKLIKFFKKIYMYISTIKKCEIEREEVYIVAFGGKKKKREMMCLLSLNLKKENI